jgi:outer membrane lipoprotein-sorting protein
MFKNLKVIVISLLAVGVINGCATKPKQPSAQKAQEAAQKAQDRLDRE